MRVAWTLADLAGKDRPGVGDVMDAVDMFTGTVEGQDSDRGGY
jgi:magnesium chelatase family protein